MKQYSSLFLASAFLTIASCTVVERPEEETIEKHIIGQELTIQASREADLDTKTVRIENGGAVLWTPGDAISLFYGSGTDGGSRFVSNATEISEVTNFTGTITAITGGANVSLQDTYFWGIYPYGDDVSCDGASVTMILPTQQKAVPGTFDTMLFPSIGRSQGLIMGFYNVCGGWRFSVTKEGVRKVTLKSNGGEMIAGKIKVGLDSSGIPYIDEVIDGSDEVILECPLGDYFEVGKSYYMVLLPGTLASGFTMTFETYTEEGVYNRTAKTTINRSKFIGITDIDNYLTTPYARKTGNIPIEDAYFKTYLVENFDDNGDGEISYEEAGIITSISVVTAASTNSSMIRSCQGIEYMENLSQLSCNGDYDKTSGPDCHSISYGFMNKLDISNNHALSTLKCSGNRIERLDVSRCVELRALDCSGNQLSSLDVSNNLNLTSLACDGNNLEELDVSNNVNLKTLSCWFNQLSYLDVSKNIELSYFGCYHNNLTSLDISKNTLLTTLTCTYNQIDNLDVSNCAILRYLYCGRNPMTNLDVSNNRELQILCIDWNNINDIDISNNTELYHFDCTDNGITSLDVSNNTKLSRLYCLRNQLTTLDISHNTNLKELECSYNLLTSLDVSKNTSLNKLWCFDNLLPNLDVSKNTGLIDFDCSPMNNSEGINLMTALYISQGQEIPNVIPNRSDDFIPAETEIVIRPNDGGGEGTSDEEVDP